MVPYRSSLERAQYKRIIAHYPRLDVCAMVSNIFFCFYPIDSGSYLQTLLFKGIDVELEHLVDN